MTSERLGARQVRLELDVVALLQADEANDGLSLSAAANRTIRLLRQNRAGGPGGPPAPPSPAHVTTRALVRRGPRGARALPGECRHPVSRRIGDRCAMCGMAVR